MHQRSFEIIRKPELVKTSFLFNNVEVTYVGTCPETGISFYCSLEHNYGVRVYPNGQKVLVNPTFNSSENCKVAYNRNRKQRYLYFKNAFGQRKHIQVSHAVWMANGNDLDPGKTMDHIDGCTTHNFIGNLRLLDNATNNRDGGFLTILCNRGFDPVRIPRHLLLIYFDRMAVIKKTVTRYRYEHLTAADLGHILYDNKERVIAYFKDEYNIKISFNHAK